MPSGDEVSPLKSSSQCASCVTEGWVYISSLKQAVKDVTSALITTPEAASAWT